MKKKICELKIRREIMTYYLDNQEKIVHYFIDTFVFKLLFLHKGFEVAYTKTNANVLEAIRTFK